jgi:hypothetical protein
MMFMQSTTIQPHVNVNNKKQIIAETVGRWKAMRKMGKMLGSKEVSTEVLRNYGRIEKMTLILGIQPQGPSSQF